MDHKDAYARTSSVETSSDAKHSDGIALAIRLSQNCYESYQRALPETKKVWNRAVFESIAVKDGRVVETIFEEPFKTLLGKQGF